MGSHKTTPYFFLYKFPAIMYEHHPNSVYQEIEEQRAENNHET
jgi:hypothetical protein